MKQFRLVLLLAALCLPLRPNVHPLAEITGTGAAVQVSTSPARAKWIQIIADKGNSAEVWFGDSTVAIGVGLKIPAGGGYNTPTCDQCIYTPAAHWIYIANGDKVTLAWGD